MSRPIFFHGALNRRGRKAARMVLRAIEGRGGLYPWQCLTLRTGYLVCSRPGARPLLPHPERFLRHPAVPDGANVLPIGQAFDRWVADIMDVLSFLRMTR